MSAVEEAVGPIGPLSAHLGVDSIISLTVSELNNPTIPCGVGSVPAIFCARLVDEAIDVAPDIPSKLARDLIACRVSRGLEMSKLISNRVSWGV